MTSTIGYALRAEYDGTVEDFDGQTSPTFLGGVLAVDGHDFDVRAELEQGSGTITVDANNVALINALDEYAPLKRVAVDENAGEPITGHDAKPVAELREELRRRELDASGNKADLVARLTAADAAIAAGDPIPEAAAGEPATTGQEA